MDVRHLTALALLILLSVAACGGDDSRESTAEAAGGVQTDIRPEDQAFAEAIVLRLDDLPSGWRQEADDGDDDPSVFDRCGIDVSDLTVNGRAASPGFVRGAATFVTSNATVFASEQEARAAYETVTSEEFLSCFRDFIEEDQTGGVTIESVAVGPLSFPTYGDESMAIQAAIDLSSEGVEVSTFFDLVWVRSGRVIAGVGFGDVLTPFPDPEKQELVAKVVLNMGAEIPSGVDTGGAPTGVDGETGA